MSNFIFEDKDILMRNSITIEKLDTINNQRINTLVNLDGTSIELGRNNPVLRTLMNEEGENFANYIDQLGLAKDPNLVVLSSLHHYYYDAEEMTNVKTVVNLKELNQIKQLNDFLHSIFHILPSGCNLIGCFINNKKQSGFILNTSPSDSYYKRNSDAIENGIASSSPFLNMIFNMIDSKTNKYMSERSVSMLLREHGFKVLDMTEYDGLTYFCAQSLRTADN
jgi:hypothetical protein